MTARLSPQHIPATTPSRGLRVWHLSLAVLFTAIAIVNIQDQRIRDPRLLVLVTAGFAGYAFLAWLGWREMQRRRLPERLGRVASLTLYLASLAALFLVATFVYVALEVIVVARAI